MCLLQLQPTMRGWKTNIPVNFQASPHALCTFQQLRVYGMLGHSEGSLPQSVWSPVICCWPKPGSTPSGDLALGTFAFTLRDRTMHLIDPTVVALNPQRFPPVSIPTWGILTALLPSTLDAPGLQTPLYPINLC